MDAEILLEVPGCAARREIPSVRHPSQPKSLRETGLDAQLLTELVAKVLSQYGKTHLSVLGNQLRLPVSVLNEVLDSMQAERLIENTWRGETDLDVRYQLTMAGKQHAAECLARSRYCGPAPVTLQAYAEVVASQSARSRAAERVAAADMAAAFADDFLPEAVRDTIGAAMHGSRSLLLHGAPGSGKSTLARKLGRLQRGVIAVPHALVVDQQIVQLFDPGIHLAPSAVQLRLQGERRSIDNRWVMCQRPLVVVGAQLHDGGLEMRRDEVSGVLYAPPQLQANNGMLVIDDLGRQRGMVDILDRLSCALEAGVDQVTLHGSHKMNMPFDAMTIFATNVAPHQLLDAAQMRRIDYKVHLGALDPEAYRQLFRQQCRAFDIGFDEAAFDYLAGRLHASSGKPMLAGCPRELLARIVEFASYAGLEPRLCPASLEQAWTSMFASPDHGEG